MASGTDLPTQKVFMYSPLGVLLCRLCNEKHQFITRDNPRKRIGGFLDYGYICPTTKKHGEIRCNSTTASALTASRPGGSVEAVYRE
jgi:hypothetical protein